jgi:hypothetical protein
VGSTTAANLHPIAVNSHPTAVNVHPIAVNTHPIAAKLHPIAVGREKQGNIGVHPEYSNCGRVHKYERHAPILQSCPP